MALAMLQDVTPEMVPLLDEAGIEAAALHEKLNERLRPGESEMGPGELPYTAPAKRVLEATMQSARRRHQADGTGRKGAKITTLDLLAGILATDKGVAVDILRDAGLKLNDNGFEVVADRAVPSPVNVVIDDGSDRSIYEQIVSQIKEQIAVGDLQPGERLPPVRRLADRLDIAPGTVARAYSDLERLGLVVTGGARGTRVAERHRAKVPDSERAGTLVGLLRPVAVAAFHLGADAEEVRRALDEAMDGIFNGGGESLE